MKINLSGRSLFFGVLLFAITILFVSTPIRLLGQKVYTEEFALNELRPGMSCYAVSNLTGETKKKIELKIVGDTSHPFFAEKRIILAEMRHKMPVIAGTSGSPVYCGKKILGAVAFEFGGFPQKGALAGITPIGYMRDQRATLGRKLAPGSIGLFTRLESGDTAEPVNGRSMDWMDKLSSYFPFTTLSLGPDLSGESGTNVTKPGKISPGDSVIMLLSRGAFQLGGICTVTEVTDKDFLACGHPFIDDGAIKLPVNRISTATSYRSTYKSFKVLGKILEPVGTIVYDNAFAVKGVREVWPDIMIPVNLSVNVDADHYDYRFDVIRHKFFTSMLVENGTRFLLSKLWADTHLVTTRLSAKIFLKGKSEPIEIYDADLITMLRTSVKGAETFTDPWRVIAKLQKTVAAIGQSEWNLIIERIELTIDIWSGNRMLKLDSLAVLDANGKPTEEFRAGDTLTVIFGMQSGNSDLKIVKKFTVEIPKDLDLIKPSSDAATSLPVKLFIMSGTKYQEMDPKKLPKSEPESAEEFISTLRLNQRNPSEMFAVLVLPPERQAEDASTKNFPELQPDAWNPVKSLDFLRKRQAISEPRVLYIQLGAPLKDAIVSSLGVQSLKLIIK